MNFGEWMLLEIIKIYNMNRITVGIVLAIVIVSVNAGDCMANIVIGGAPCERDFDCGNNFDYGKCKNNTCVCAKGYLNADCSYQAKSALKIGLSGLALLAGIPSIPAFLAGDLQWALPQLLIAFPPFIGAIIGSVFLCRGGIGNGAVAGVTIALVVLGYLAYGAACAWTIADAVMYGTKDPIGHACDGNGFPLVD
ncbi:hypothetical protein PRJ_Fausto_00277 [Faustovirus]|nr:hypothetical protein PRJ_Fausto_00277 [Faustovirus]